MAEIVGAELQLETIRGFLPLRRHHHAGVVDKQIEAVSLAPQPRAEIRWGLETGKIDLLKPDGRRRHFSADSRDSIRAFLRIAARDDDLATRAPNFQGIL